MLETILYDQESFKIPYRRLLRRRMIDLFVGFRFFRVDVPLVGFPVGVTG